MAVRWQMVKDHFTEQLDGGGEGDNVRIRLRGLFVVDVVPLLHDIFQVAPDLFAKFHFERKQCQRADRLSVHQHNRQMPFAFPYLSKLFL